MYRTPRFAARRESEPSSSFGSLRWKTTLYGLARLLNFKPEQTIALADEMSFFQTPAITVDQSLEATLATRPEMKVERVSYPVITPSAARGLLEAILYKPQFRWRIRRIARRDGQRCR